jgi:hypothetical protein
MGFKKKGHKEMHPPRSYFQLQQIYKPGVPMANLHTKFHPTLSSVSRIETRGPAECLLKMPTKIQTTG